MLDIIATRHHLHELAEASFEEWQTLSYLVSKVKDYKRVSLHFLKEGTYEKFKDFIDKPYVIHEFLGHKVDVPALFVSFDLAKKGPHLAFRSDMDALHILESHQDTHRPFKEGFVSKTDCTHACGHDGHMALALSLIDYIDANFDFVRKNSPYGKITILFQCAEEGCRGAKVLLDDPIFDNIDVLYCYHLGMKLPSRTIATNPSNFLATTKFSLELFGKKAHAGHPEDGANALTLFANIISDAMELLDTEHGQYINFSDVTCEGECNVVPDYVKCMGEIRSYDKESLDKLYQKFLSIISSRSQVNSLLSTKLTIKGCASDIKQSTKLTDIIASCAKDNGLNLDTNFKFSASEDASLLIDKVQANGGLAAYFIIGADIQFSHHNSAFDFDENMLPIGSELIKKLIFKI